MSTNMEELGSGLLVLGLSNTIYFGQGALHELVLLDISTGKDFSMQISEEQASYLVSVLNGDNPQEAATQEEVTDAGEQSAWGHPEATPQL